MVLLKFARMGEKTRALARAAALQMSIFATYCTLGAKRLAQSEFRLFVSQLPLDWPSQGGESMVTDVQPSKFRKNFKYATRQSRWKQGLALHPVSPLFKGAKEPPGVIAVCTVIL